MPRKKDKKDELDTETTFVDMNVEGFKWYSPSAKKNDQGKVKHRITRREYWQMVRGAFAAILPFFGIFLLAMGLVIALMYIWLA